MQRTKSFEAYDVKTLSDKINMWLDRQAEENTKVEITSIINVTIEDASEHKNSDYSVSVIVLYNEP